MVSEYENLLYPTDRVWERNATSTSYVGPMLASDKIEWPNANASVRNALRSLFTFDTRVCVRLDGFVWVWLFVHTQSLANANRTYKKVMELIRNGTQMNSRRTWAPALDDDVQQPTPVQRVPLIDASMQMMGELTGPFIVANVICKFGRVLSI